MKPGAQRQMLHKHSVRNRARPVTQEDAFLQAIIESPDDDAPRLVFADWLDDHGDDERAEAIRLAVRLRGRGPIDLDPEAWALLTRIEDLEQRHGDRWRAAAPNLDGVYLGLGEGGFLTDAHIQSVEALLHHEKRIFSAGPIRRLSVLLDNPGDADLLASCRSLARVRRLGLHGDRPEDFGLSALALSPWLRGVRKLDLSRNYQHSSFLPSLAAAPRWPGLEELDLTLNGFSAAAFRTLGGAPLLSTLKSLNVSRCVLRGQPLRELLRSTHLPRLRRFLAGENFIGPTTVRDLTAVDWQHLEVLDLSSNNLTAASARDLAGRPFLARLKRLDLSANRLGDAGVQALAASPWLSRRLRRLDVGFCGVTSKGLEHLAGAGWLGKLAWLDLNGTHIGPAEADVLAAAPLAGLGYLALSYADLRIRALRKLLGAPWMAGLVCLDLDNTALDDAGARAIAEAPNLDRIARLDLCGNRFSTRASELLTGRFGDRVKIERED
jgi:uncharacterized protein (TIGR02996 family)